METGSFGGASSEAERFDLLDPLEHLLREFLAEDGDHSIGSDQDLVDRVGFVQRVLARVVLAELVGDFVD